MLGKTHLAVGLAVPLAAHALALAPLPPAWPAWAGLGLGALAPDIDGEGSICYLGNFLPGHLAPAALVRLLNWLGRTISSAIRAIFGHRAAFHAPLWGGLLIGAGWYYGEPLLLWFGVGYLLHLAADMLTRAGVPLLWPITKRDFSLLPLKTGGFVESALAVLLWGFIAWRAALLALTTYDLLPW